MKLKTQILRKYEWYKLNLVIILISPDDLTSIHRFVITTNQSLFQIILLGISLMI